MKEIKVEVGPQVLDDGIVESVRFEGKVFGFIASPFKRYLIVNDIYKIPQELFAFPDEFRAPCAYTLVFELKKSTITFAPYCYWGDLAREGYMDDMDVLIENGIFLKGNKEILEAHGIKLIED